jgi:hypothetical protein
MAASVNNRLIPAYVDSDQIRSADLEIVATLLVDLASHLPFRGRDGNSRICALKSLWQCNENYVHENLATGFTIRTLGDLFLRAHYLRSILVSAICDIRMVFLQLLMSVLFEGRTRLVRTL